MIKRNKSIFNLLHRIPKGRRFRRRLSSETSRLNGSTGHPLPGNRNSVRLSGPQETNHALRSGTKPVLQSDSELFVMIGLVADNRKGPVKLLGEKGAHDLMGKGHGRKRQPTVGPLVHFRRETVRPAYHETEPA